MAKLTKEEMKDLLEEYTDMLAIPEVSRPQMLVRGVLVRPTNEFLVIRIRQLEKELAKKPKVWWKTWAGAIGLAFVVDAVSDDINLPWGCLLAIPFFILSIIIVGIAGATCTLNPSICKASPINIPNVNTTGGAMPALQYYGGVGLVFALLFLYINATTKGPVKIAALMAWGCFLVTFLKGVAVPVIIAALILQWFFGFKNLFRL